MLARKLLRFATFRGQTRDAQADLQRSNMVWDAIADASKSFAGGSEAWSARTAASPHAATSMPKPT